MKAKNILIGVVLIAIMAAVAVFGYKAVHYVYYGRTPVCTSSEGHLIWYTDSNGSCMFVNYDSCVLALNHKPFGTKTDCSMEDKIQIVKTNNIRLVGQPAETFSETCQAVSDQTGYDQVSYSEARAEDWGLDVATFTKLCSEL